MTQTFNTILSFVKSTSRKDRRKGVGSLSVSAVAGGGVGSIADSATQAWVRDNFVDKTTEQEISALKIFSQGIKIGDVSLFKHPDGYVYLDETLVLKGGVVMYGNSSGVDVPSIFDSLPIDGYTIKRDGNGALYVDETALSISGGGGGGGVADSVRWNDVIGKPSWIGSTKPSYKYSEIEERPDLSVYALASSIPTNNNQLTNGAGYITSSALNGYATQTWVEGKKYLTGITSSMITSALGFTPYNSANFTKANIISTLGISDWALASAKPTYKYSEISNTPDLSVYALNTDVVKKWTQNDAKIANWDSAYSWGNHANAGYAKASDVTNEFKNYVKLLGDSQSITAQHNFANGLKIGGVSLRKVDNYLYLDSSLVLSGGVTMYGDDGTTVKPIWESIPFDRTTIDWVNGMWTVVGGVGSGGGISEEFLNVTLQGYQPLLSTTNKLPYSLISGTPDLSVYALNTSIPTKLSQLTDDVVAGKYLPITGGTINGTNYNPLSIASNDNSLMQVLLYTKDTLRGRVQYNVNFGVGFQNVGIGGIYVKNDGTPIFLDSSDASKTLLHAGNYSNLLAGGTINGSISATSFIGNLTGTASGNLPLTGGTINGTNYNPLSIASNDNSLMQVLLYTKDTLRGCVQYNANYGVGFENLGIGGIYVKNDGTPIFLDSSDASKTLLHAGNYSNLLAGGTINGSITATSFVGNLTGLADKARDSDKLAGYGLTRFLLMTGRDYTAMDLNTIGDSQSIFTEIRTSEITTTNSPFSGYGALLSLKDGRGFAKMQFAGTVNSSALYFRSQQSGVASITSDWKTIAFTDSNVASATKLATARTIWGQSFDGTGDITGDLTIPNNNSIKVKSSGGVVYSVLKMSTANSLSIGQESASNGRTTMIYGNLIRLRCGTGGTDALYVNESGNVTIGTSDLAGATNKMYVDGDVTFSSKVVVGTIPVYQSADGTLFVDANVVFRGGVAMYGDTTTTINEE